MPAVSKPVDPTPAVVTEFSWSDVDGLEAQVAADAIARQQAFLAEHTEWAPCIIPGCTGVVRPDVRPDGSYVYIKVYQGRRTGLCSRTKAHNYLRAHREG